MNKTFLEYVAEDIISKYGTDLSRIAVVFPNKRAALFLNEHLARLAGQPVWSPAYITISDLFRQHTDLKTADPIKLICDIHKSFTKCTGIDETLDHFYGWGQLLLADFDDIDKNMADADSIFCNLKDIHELDDISYLDNEQKEMLARFFANFSDDIDSELKKRFLSLWSHFGDIYHDYNRRLTEQGIGYEGAIYRKVASEQTLHLKYDKYLFVGFNLLQKVERVLFSRLMKENKAKFYWDFDEYYMPSPSPLPSGGALVGGYGIPAIPTQPTCSVGALPGGALKGGALVSSAPRTSAPTKQYHLTIGGIIDRLDILTDKQTGKPRIRVVDYKTGNQPSSPIKNIDEIFDPNNIRSKHSNYYLQAILYSLIVSRSKRWNPAGHPVSPALLFIKQAPADHYDPTLHIDKHPISDVTVYEEEFLTQLKHTLADIYSPDTPFTPTDDRKKCELCPYRMLCGL